MGVAQRVKSSRGHPCGNSPNRQKRNLLRPTLIFGIRLAGLLALVAVVIVAQVIGQGSIVGNVVTLAIAALGFAGLRILNRIGRVGWDEAILFAVETFLSRRHQAGTVTVSDSGIQVTPPDTLDEIDLIRIKERLADRLRRLLPGERLTYATHVGACGIEIKKSARPRLALALRSPLQ